MKTFTPPRKAVLLCIALLAFLLTNRAYALTLVGPTKACPGTSRQYVVGEKLDITKATVIYNPGVAGSYSTSYYISHTTTFDATFSPGFTGNVFIRVESWNLYEGNPFGATTATLTVSVRVPSPNLPNGGVVTACQVGEQVLLSSLPALKNDPDDCFFHYEVEWAAPNGWTLQNDDNSGNPLSSFTGFSNTRLIVPSGVVNGNVGQVSITAYYSNGNSYTMNTSNTAPIWYGGPVATNPTVNNAPSQSFNNVPNGNAYLTISSSPSLGVSWTWQVDGGSGTLNPSGSSCYVSTSNFVRVIARATNRCGQGDFGSYFFYIKNSSTPGYRTAPNPASSNMTVQFDHPEMTEAIDAVTLYDEKGNPVKDFDGKKAKKEKYFERNRAVDWDVKNLQPGRYFLHVNYGSYIEKSQIAIN